MGRRGGFRKRKRVKGYHRVTVPLREKGNRLECPTPPMTDFPYSSDSSSTPSVSEDGVENGHGQTLTKEEYLKVASKNFKDNYSNRSMYRSVDDSGTYIKFRVVLLGTYPPIWRRFGIPQDSEMYALHIAIQDVMGYTDKYQHNFEIRQPESGIIHLLSCTIPGQENEYWTSSDIVVEEIQVGVRDYFNEKNNVALYSYHVDDVWEHEIIFEGLFQCPDKTERAICFEGEYNCPVEITGSLSAYKEVLNALKYPNTHEEYCDRFHYLINTCQEYDFDTFDPDSIRFTDPFVRYKEKYGSARVKALDDEFDEFIMKFCDDNTKAVFRNAAIDIIDDSEEEFHDNNNNDNKRLSKVKDDDATVSGTTSNNSNKNAKALNGNARSHCISSSSSGSGASQSNLIKGNTSKTVKSNKHSGTSKNNSVGKSNAGSNNHHRINDNTTTNNNSNRNRKKINKFDALIASMGIEQQTATVANNNNNNNNNNGNNNKRASIDKNNASSSNNNSNLLARYNKTKDLVNDNKKNADNATSTSAVVGGRKKLNNAAIGGLPHAGLLYELKISLKRSNPKIWRRIQVPAYFTFWELHVAIQNAMRWNGTHAHFFEVLNSQRTVHVIASGDDNEYVWNMRKTLIAEEFARLGDYFNCENLFASYIYNLRAFWDFQIILDAILPIEADTRYPRCVGGKRASPPENFGGIVRYEHCLAVSTDPNHPTFNMIEKEIVTLNEMLERLTAQDGESFPLSSSVKFIDRCNIDKIMFADAKQCWRRMCLAQDDTEDQVALIFDDHQQKRINNATNNTVTTITGTTNNSNSNSNNNNNNNNNADSSGGNNNINNSSTSSSSSSSSSSNNNNNTATNRKDTDTIYQIKITVVNDTYVMWKRIHIKSKSNFRDLHLAILNAVGWTDDDNRIGLHSFEMFNSKTQYTDLIIPAAKNDPVYFPRTIKTRPFVEENTKLYNFFTISNRVAWYEFYDTNIVWRCKIYFEKSFQMPKSKVTYPICVAGKGSFPAPVRPSSMTTTTTKTLPAVDEDEEDLEANLLHEVNAVLSKLTIKSENDNDNNNNNNNNNSNDNKTEQDDFKIVFNEKVVNLKEVVDVVTDAVVDKIATSVTNNINNILTDNIAIIDGGDDNNNNNNNNNTDAVNTTTIVTVDNDNNNNNNNNNRSDNKTASDNTTARKTITVDDDTVADNAATIDRADNNDDDHFDATDATVPIITTTNTTKNIQSTDDDDDDPYTTTFIANCANTKITFTSDSITIFSETITDDDNTSTTTTDTANDNNNNNNNNNNNSSTNNNNVDDDDDNNDNSINSRVGEENDDLIQNATTTVEKKFIKLFRPCEFSTDQHRSFVYQFKITLVGVKPEIWRRVFIPSNFTFWQFHVAIQDAMGWTDRYTHQFEIATRDSNCIHLITLSDSLFESSSDRRMPEDKMRLSQYFLRKNDAGMYIYDPGNQWEHVIQVENMFITQGDEEIHRPICLEGEMACPPEDCGGRKGYLQLLTIINDPNYRHRHLYVKWFHDQGVNDPFHFHPSEVVFTDANLRWKYRRCYQKSREDK